MTNNRDKLQPLFDAVEDVPFAAEFHTISGTKGMIRFLRNQPDVSELRSVAKSDGRAAQLILKRLRRLARKRVDEGYESPYDAAIAALLSVAAALDASIAMSAANAAIHAPQTWWAQKLARAVLRGANPFGASVSVAAPTSSVETVVWKVHRPMEASCLGTFTTADNDAGWLQQLSKYDDAVLWLPVRLSLQTQSTVPQEHQPECGPWVSVYDKPLARAVGVRFGVNKSNAATSRYVGEKRS